MPETTLAESIEIQVGLGVSFHVSAENFWRAQKAATQTGLTHYIGNLPSGQEVTGCDDDALEAMGCDAIVPVFPERRTPMQQFGDFVMYGPERA